MDDVSAPAKPVRLTSLAHGGGCGCKIAPAVLQEILAEMPAAAAFPNLLVGTETSDDAAVWRLNDAQALVATTDFFMPVVDDPFDFGRIAATNALSDIYAMGGRPIFALAVLGMPIDRLDASVIRAIRPEIWFTVARRLSISRRAWSRANCPPRHRPAATAVFS